MSNLYRNPLAQLEEEKREHDNKMKKMEMEMEQVFEMKVKEKRHKLKDSEADVSKAASLVSFFLHFNGRFKICKNLFKLVYLDLDIINYKPIKRKKKKKRFSKI